MAIAHENTPLQGNVLHLKPSFWGFTIMYDVFGLILLMHSGICAFFLDFF